VITFSLSLNGRSQDGPVLVRNLPAEVVKKLKSRAKQYRRSLQEELKDILEQAAEHDVKDVQAKVNKVRKLFAAASLVTVPI
jgi:plasmid stability protein